MTGSPPTECTNLLELEWLPGRYAVCRISASSAIPDWAVSQPSSNGRVASLWCVTRTDKELSIVIDESAVPAAFDATTPIQRGFVAMRIVGTLDFALVGVLARLTAVLAAADISVFVISTYDTDIILVREDDRQRANGALAAIGEFRMIASCALPS